MYDEDFGQYTTLEQFMRALCDTVSSPQRYHDTGTDVRLSSVAESTLGKAGNTDWGALGNVLVEVVGVLRHPIICAKTLRLFSKGYAQKAHYPLLCLSWLDSLEGNWKWYEEYVKVFVNCPVNVIVYNENNNIAAQIIDGSVNESYDELVAYVDDDGQKVIVIPQNAEYMIQMDAYDSGNVTYTLEECGIENSMPERLVSFSDISVTTGETLTGIVPKKELDSSSRYQLLSGDGGLTPDVDLTGADIRTYQVTVSAMGNGVVNGGGSYTVGEFSKVSATSNKGSAFEGWYINDQFVSQEMEYRFCVTADTNAVAKFVPSEQITISKKPSIKKPAAAKGMITVKWSHFKHTTKKTKAIWKKIKKVQIQCATDKGFTNIVKAGTVGKSKTKATIKGLSKKTIYYVRVRYYDGTGYSKWSGAKKIKTK